jgi:ribosomal protein L40E
MAKRKADLTDFFSPGKAPTPTLDGPKSLFESDAERRQKVTVIKHGKPVSVYAFSCCRDGTITGGCYHVCTRQWVDFLHFAPEDPGNRTKFEAAYDAFQAAHARGDRDECLKQQEILKALRTTECAKCRDRKKLGPAEQACKDWYDAARKAAAIENDGCAHAHCPVRGADAWQVLTADHGTKPKKTHEVTNRTTGKVTTKPLNLGDYIAWPKLGGVPAMEAEAAQIEKWICRCCHALEPTSSSGRRCGDPATMPEGKRRGTPLETQQYGARLNAKIRYPKQQHVDARKRAIGACATCKRAVVPGTEPAFEFNHLDEATKCKGGLFGPRGGVSGLVGNVAKAAALDQVRDLLDAEMAKCELLCSNCHHRHTHKYGADGEEEEAED